jgi:hypothetical protein
VGTKGFVFHFFDKKCTWDGTEETNNTKICQEMVVTVTQVNREVVSENAGTKSFALT